MPTEVIGTCKPPLEYGDGFLQLSRRLVSVLKDRMWRRKGQLCRHPRLTIPPPST